MASPPTGATLPLSSIPPPSALGSVPTFTATTPGTTPPLGSGTTPPSLSSLLATVMSATPATLGIKAAKPLAYSPVLPPIPAKAVEKIRAGSYIDLKELLADNIALSERYQELGHPLLPNAQAAPKLRSITDPLTWVFCFLSYMAAATECDATRDMAAYAQIVIQQARKHPGPGWLAYDQLFRQQRAAGAALPWNDLASSLMASTVLRARDACSLCHFPDHPTEQCALFTECAASHANKGSGDKTGPGHGSSRHGHNFRPYPPPQLGQTSDCDEACRRFNRGFCPYRPGSCPYLHACLSCNSPNHGLHRCPNKKDDKGKGRTQLPTPAAKQPTTSSS